MSSLTGKTVIYLIIVLIGSSVNAVNPSGKNFPPTGFPTSLITKEPAQFNPGLFISVESVLQQLNVCRCFLLVLVVVLTSQPVTEESKPVARMVNLNHYHLGEKAELPFSLNTDLSKGFTIAQRELTASEGIGTENKEQVAVQITV